MSQKRNSYLNLTSCKKLFRTSEEEKKMSEFLFLLVGGKDFLFKRIILNSPISTKILFLLKDSAEAIVPI